MSPQETFVGRLRRYRERNGIPLAQIAATTRIKRELLEALEQNDLSAWPRGVYARAWVSAYASAVGLDPLDTVDGFCRLFPQGDRRTGPMIQEMAAIVAQPSAYRDEFSHRRDRRGLPPRINVMPAPVWHMAYARALQGMWVRFVVACRAYSAPRLKRNPQA
jgi:transcriptional regulator with XRE-family HTH domain